MYHEIVIVTDDHSKFLRTEAVGKAIEFEERQMHDKWEVEKRTTGTSYYLFEVYWDSKVEKRIIVKVTYHNW